MLQLRVGFEIIYQSARTTPMLLALCVHPSRAADLVRHERFVSNAFDVALSSTFGPNKREGFRVWTDPREAA
jgi:hypothetical protein